MCLECKKKAIGFKKIEFLQNRYSRVKFYTKMANKDYYAKSCVRDKENC